MGLVPLYFNLRPRGVYLPSAGQSGFSFSERPGAFFTENFLVSLSAGYLLRHGLFLDSAALPLTGPGLQVLRGCLVAVFPTERTLRSVCHGFS